MHFAVRRRPLKEKKTALALNRSARAPAALTQPVTETLRAHVIVAVGRQAYILRPLTLLIEAPERAVKHPDVPRRGCLAAGYI